MSVVLLRGDARELPLADASVDLIVTSPPYFGQRDYRDNGQSMAGQIGSEETPREYIAALLDCTREWMRVLRPDGSLFVNLGDKYSQRIQVRRSSHQPGIFPGKFEEFAETWAERAASGATRLPYQNVISDDGGYVAEKSLMQLPQRYSIACTDHLGLILRRDNIWSKSSGMPESVTDRCATRHEYLFHFVKQMRYFAAIDEIRLPLAAPGRKAGASAFRARNASLQRSSTGAYAGQNELGALPGSVWEMAATPLTVPDHLAHARCCNGRKRDGCEDGLEHYAAFPVELPRRVILGWSPSGVCTECGEGRRPQVLREIHPDAQGRIGTLHAGDRGRLGHAVERRMLDGVAVRTITGYGCACPEPVAATRPAIVLDPFGGTGTTSLVADVLGRTGISVDRSADYCRLARWRTTDPSARAKALQVPKPPPVIDGQESLFEVGA